MLYNADDTLAVLYYSAMLVAFGPFPF